VARHTQVDRAEVRGWIDGAALHLEVRDEGAGFVPEATDLGRLGLLGMRERIELLGGEFRVESAPARGTRVAARVPLSATHEGRGE